MSIRIYKFCNKCQTEQSIDNFFYNKSSNSYGNCKTCIKEYRMANRDRLNAQRRERRKNNSTEKEYMDDYRKKNKEKINEQSAEWRKNNREKIRKQEKIRNEKNPRTRTKLNPEKIVIPESKTCKDCGENKLAENFHKNHARTDGLQNCCKNCQKKYNQENKNQYNQSRRKNYQTNPEVKKKAYKARNEKIKNNPSFKIRVRLSDRIGAAIRNCNPNSQKIHQTITLTGCSIDFLRKYLESLWTEGMSWDNYGLDGWHIDHIIPCCAFDLTTEENQRKCFHYTNLQPLWWYDNLAKSSKDKLIKKNSMKIKKSVNIAN